MKWFKRLSIWIIISLGIQLIVLFYLNNYLFIEDTYISIDRISENHKGNSENEIRHNKDIVVKVPQEARKINLSYKAEYLSYYLNGKIEIVSTLNGKSTTVNLDKYNEIANLKWLPDRNRLIIIEKRIEQNHNDLILSYFDVDKNNKSEVKEIELYDKECEVEQIEVSTLTNIIYIKLSHKGSRSTTYRLDITNDINKVKLEKVFVGKISLLKHDDILIYEDLIENDIFSYTYFTGEENQIKIKETERLALISVDKKDNIYLGKLDDNKVTEIYYGKYNRTADRWKKIKLAKAKKRENIYVDTEGRVFIKDGLNGIITEVNSGRVYNYKGNFLQIYENGITYITEGQLVKRDLNFYIDSN